MSRSYKKTWGFKDNPAKGMKRLANKRVRQTKNIMNGGSFKKVFCSYDISDWKFLCFTKKQKRDIINNKENKFTVWWRWRGK
ncbi:MAG: hypothetical protein PF569_01490 [Candidatus Woesearchaeota archaeon]|jgi:hypothetical protein|nr:hypothetical protein [Candidatus Woesearchaeota archaeon]